jgi:hypothetical protein
MQRSCGREAWNCGRAILVVFDDRKASVILLLVRLVVEFLVERQFNIIKIAGESAITRSADRCAGNEGEKKAASKRGLM